MFVALRSPAGNASPIMTSSDAATWREQYVNTPNFLNDVTYGAGLFVAVGDRGTLADSHDGTLWINRSRYVTATIAITFGNGIYVAVGYQPWAGASQGGLNILTSTNAIAWTRAKLVESFRNLLAVAFGGGQFVAIGQRGTICNSLDGLNWKSQAGFLSGQPTDFQAITYGQGLFVAVAFGGQIFTSPDGVNWVRQESGTTRGILDIAYGNGLFVAGSHDGEILTSSDGFTWVPRSVTGLDRGQSFSKLVFGNDVFCAFVEPDLMCVSRDGLTWSKVFTMKPGVSLYGMCFGNGRFVAVGHVWNANQVGSVVFSSQDGTNWLQRICGLENTGDDGLIMDVTYGGGTFVAVGGERIMQSGMFDSGATLQRPEFSKAKFGVEIKGVVGQVYRVQMGTDLSTGGWVDYGMVTNWISPIRFLDRNTVGLQRRFYRVVSP